MINDIERTRVRERIVYEPFKDEALKLLIYYLKENNISYKQGLNEIIGPFLLLKSKMKISLSRIYQLFVCFVDKFLTNYYWEEEFYALQGSLSLIALLLKYHEPEIFFMLDNCMITPEMYATSWILTLFANKNSMDVVYHFWDKLILFNDSLLPHFMTVSFIIKHKKKILSKETPLIPSILSQLNFTSKEEVDEILEYAMDLNNTTPYSFSILARKLEIFNLKSSNLKVMYEQIDPDNLISLPIFPNESLMLTYKDSFGCPEPDCENFDIRKHKFNPTNNKCPYCFSKRFEKRIKHLILDLRTIDNIANITPRHPGYLPQTLPITESELVDSSYPHNLVEKFYKDKEKYHFLFITSQTDYFKEYEDKYYKEGDNDESNMIGLSVKMSKELDIEYVNSLIKQRKSHKFGHRVLEFDNLKKIITLMLHNKFPYVSYAYGGFDDIHSFSIKYNVELLGHGSNCYLCEKNVKTGYRILNGIKSFFNKRTKAEATQNDDNEETNQHSNKSQKEVLKAVTIEPKAELVQTELDQLLTNKHILNYVCQYRTDYDVILTNCSRDSDSSSSSIPTKEITIYILLGGNNIVIYQELKDFKDPIYILIRDIRIEKIESISVKNKEGNIITLYYYTENEKDILFMTIDFINPQKALEFREKLGVFKRRKIFESRTTD